MFNDTTANRRVLAKVQGLPRGQKCGTFLRACPSDPLEHLRQCQGTPPSASPTAGSPRGGAGIGGSGHNPLVKVVEGNPSECGHHMGGDAVSVDLVQM